MEFDVIPASAGVMAAFVGIIAFMLAFAGFFAWLTWSSARMSLAVDDDLVNVRVPLYGRSIRLAELDLDRAAVVDLKEDRGLSPRTRTNGIGMPGLGVGWFRLRDGTRALLAVTDRRKVLHLPTRDGFDVLLSLRDPEKVLEELRSRVGG